jgi:hypothetical protein
MISGKGHLLVRKGKDTLKWTLSSQHSRVILKICSIGAGI